MNWLFKLDAFHIRKCAVGQTAQWSSLGSVVISYTLKKETTGAQELGEMSLKQKQKNHCELLGNCALGGAEDLRIYLPIHSPKEKASKVPQLTQELNYSLSLWDNCPKDHPATLPI